MNTHTSMKISVTTSDILKGQRCSCFDCPIALALRRSTKQEWFVAWYAAKFHDTQRRLITIRLPYKALKFIEDFDSGRTVKPFSFEFKWSTTTTTKT